MSSTSKLPAARPDTYRGTGAYGKLTPAEIRHNRRVVGGILGAGALTVLLTMAAAKDGALPFQSGNRHAAKLEQEALTGDHSISQGTDQMTILYEGAKIRTAPHIAEGSRTGTLYHKLEKGEALVSVVVGEWQDDTPQRDTWGALLLWDSEENDVRRDEAGEPEVYWFNKDELRRQERQRAKSDGQLPLIEEVLMPRNDNVPQTVDIYRPEGELPYTIVGGEAYSAMIGEIVPVESVPDYKALEGITE